MPPDVGAFDTPLAYGLCIIQKAALIRKMIESNLRKAQVRYEYDHNLHVGFEQRFAVGHFVFSERYPLTASAADLMGLE